MLDSYLRALRSGVSLSETEAFQLCDGFLTSDTLSDSFIADVLLALAEKGEVVDELVGFVRCMRSHMKAVKLKAPIIDVCGTGGALGGRFNVSTTVAFLLAAMGVPVAKHGNNGSKRSNGSFDFLDELNVHYSASIDDIITQFKSFQLVFLYAKWFHPAMKKVSMARRTLTSRTIFNYIGPLCNPASVSHQLIGTLTMERAQLLAKTWARLGDARAYIVAGQVIDEISIQAPTDILIVEGGTIQNMTIDPEILGLKGSEPTGGLAKDNRILFEQLLEHLDMDHDLIKSMVINAAVAAHCFYSDNDLSHYVALAKNTLKSGQFSRFIHDFRTWKSN